MTRKTILVVDDDAGVRELAGQFLAHEGWEVRTAATGTDAVGDFGSRRPDLVLLDLCLPDISGGAVLARLKDIDPDVAVILLSGFGDLDVAAEHLGNGAAGFLSKPLDREALVNLVRRLLS